MNSAASVEGTSGISKMIFPFPRESCTLTLIIRAIQDSLHLVITSAASV